MGQVNITHNHHLTKMALSDCFQTGFSGGGSPLPGIVPPNIPLPPAGINPLSPPGVKPPPPPGINPPPPPGGESLSPNPPDPEPSPSPSTPSTTSFSASSTSSEGPEITAIGDPAPMGLDAICKADSSLQPAATPIKAENSCFDQNCEMLASISSTFTGVKSTSTAAASPPEVSIKVPQPAGPLPGGCSSDAICKRERGETGSCQPAGMG